MIKRTDRREAKSDRKEAKSDNKVERLEAKAELQRHKAAKWKWLFLLVALGFGIIMFASSGGAGLLTKARGLIGL